MRIQITDYKCIHLMFAKTKSLNVLLTYGRDFCSRRPQCWQMPLLFPVLFPFNCDRYCKSTYRIDVRKYSTAKYSEMRGKNLTRIVATLYHYYVILIIVLAGRLNVHLINVSIQIFKMSLVLYVLRTPDNHSTTINSFF